MTEQSIAERIAAGFHESYERQAPALGYKTRDASAVPWAEVPQANRDLMVATVADLLQRGVIVAGGADDEEYRRFVDEAVARLSNDRDGVRIAGGHVYATLALGAATRAGQRARPSDVGA